MVDTNADMGADLDFKIELDGDRQLESMGSGDNKLQYSSV